MNSKEKSAKETSAITREDLNILDCLEKGVIRQVPHILLDKLILAGLIECSFMPPDRVSELGSALLRELREAAKAQAASALAAVAALPKVG